MITNIASRHINAERLRADIETLAGIGRQEGPDAARGLFRMAFSPGDLAARAWLESRIKQAGLPLVRDGAGNVGARIGGDGPCVMTGSHLDTVPGAGHLDGALGVLAGLEVLRVVAEQNIPLAHPLELVAFSDEEGRFGGLLGSQAIAGARDRDTLAQAADLNGEALSDALATVGLTIDDVLASRRDPEQILAFVELHIEQGPVLDAENVPLGVVSGITGLFKWSVTYQGEANHAGTTPMNMRRDALRGMATLAQSIDGILKMHGSANSRATIGRVRVEPGAANVIPGFCEFSLEVRDTDPETLTRLARVFRDRLEYVAYQYELGLSIVEMSDIQPVACAAHIMRTIEAEAEALGVPYRKLPSGAAHDAQVIGSIAPMGMVFVPSKQGLSHSADEDTAWPDIEAGANVLLNTLVALASSPPPTQETPHVPGRIQR